jgi:hypothetical protein
MSKQDLEWWILEHFRQKAPNKDKLYSGKCPEARTDKAIFYYPNIADNLFLSLEDFKATYADSYQKSNGHEMAHTAYGTIKMAALKSSSAELLNTLGTKEKVITIPQGKKLPAGQYRVGFEEPMQSLSPNYPAMIDAFLVPINGDTIILDENKVLEYIDGPSLLKESYLDKEAYPKEAKNYAEAYVNLFSQFKLTRGRYKARSGDFYYAWSANTQYDVFQLIKHSFGFLNKWLSDPSLQKIKKVILVNSVLQIPDHIFDGEPNMLKKYKEIWAKESESNEIETEASHKPLEKEINEIYSSSTNDALKFEFIFLEYRDFKEQFKLEPEREKYLERYLL